MIRRNVTVKKMRLEDQDDVDWDVVAMDPMDRLDLVFALSRFNPWNDDAGPEARLQRHVVRVARREG